MVKAQCSDCTPGVKVNYTWSLQKYNPRSNMRTDADISVEDFTSAGIYSKSISFNAYKLNFGVQYYLHVALDYLSESGVMVTSYGEMPFTTNIQPYGGTCNAYPNENGIVKGYALETKFNIKCQEWKDEGDLDERPTDPADAFTDLSYAFYTKRDGATTRTLLQRGSEAGTERFFEIGNLTIFARVMDRYGEYIEEEIPVQVLKLANAAAKISEMTSGEDSLLNQMVNSGDVGAVASFTVALASVLNAGPEEGEEEEEGAADARSKVRDAMISGLEKMSSGGASTADSVGQTAKALDSITAKPDEVKGSTQSKAAATLKSVSSSFTSFDTMREDDKLGTATDITSGSGNVLTSSSLSSAKMKALKVDPSSEDFDYVDTEPSPEELEEEDRKSQEVANDVMEATKATAGAVLKNKPPGSKPITLDTPSMKMSLQRESPASLGGKKMQSGGASFKLPSGSSMVGGNSDSDDEDDAVSIATSELAHNPFPWAKSGTKSAVMSLELTGSDGKPIQVSGLQEEIVIEQLNQKPVVAEILQPELGVVSEMYYRNVTIENNHTALRVMLRPLEEGLNYTVYLRYEYSPTTEDYEHRQDIPRDDYEALGDDDEVLEEEWPYTMFVPSAELTQVGNYSIGIFQNGADENSTWANISLSIAVIGCKYFNQTLSDWSYDGVRALNTSTTQVTKCGATHLTSFATDFFVPPNSIDFGTVFQKFAKLNENASVFSTIIVILALYIVGVIFCRRADKADLIKWGVLPLADNDPDHHYYYQVNIHTGTKMGAGTKSRVSFTLFGSIMNSGVRKLEDGERDSDKLFEKGCISKFILATHGPLGKMRSLRIWHDNSGGGTAASWFLGRVEVIDLQSDDKCFFLCDKWLAVEKGDGRIERFLRSATEED
uniref:Polycystic kidney disease protein 1-like 2-like n=1 Tax=Saccoglossus kowalevskii TaxID=10224 RepID=A0ABM0MKZ3_SACKO|nr:PREDICTED: polycystic kidney disease protein 1-like 2-like [Saccoglossus kowalevskii]